MFQRISTALKLLACVAWFVIVCVAITIYSLFRWKRATNSYYFTQLFCPLAARIAGIKLIFHNQERLTAARPCVVVGNHQNNLDIIVHAINHVPNEVAIGKKEIVWMPVFGPLFYSTGNILIDRKNRERAFQNLEEARRHLTEKKISIYMFPEGTRIMIAPKLLPFK